MKSKKKWSRIFEDITDLNIELNSLPTDSKVVYTYGAWDLLHPGHTRFLLRAKELGDFLIVGTVGDKPIRNLKGNSRPVQKQEDRISNISFLRFVDATVYQEEYDPSEVLRKLSKIDILTKGDDWDYIPGTETVEELGGKLISLSYTPEYSTSKLVKKVLDEK